MVKPLPPVKLTLPLSLVAAESEELLLFDVPNCTRDDVDLERYLLAFLPAGLQVQGVRVQEDWQGPGLVTRRYSVGEEPHWVRSCYCCVCRRESLPRLQARIYALSAEYAGGEE